MISSPVTESIGVTFLRLCSDLFRWFSCVGWPQSKSSVKYVFLGSLISATNKHSLETLTLIFALKARVPSNRRSSWEP